MSKSCPYRWFLAKTRISEKLSDCLVFCRNILAIRPLAVMQLSDNCLDGLLMKRELSDEKNYQMKGIKTTGIACDGRILKTGIWVLQHQLIGQMSDSKSAQQGQAACPTWESTLPHLGKHRAHLWSIYWSMSWLVSLYFNRDRRKTGQYA